jgi:hypothetical protein
VYTRRVNSSVLVFGLSPDILPVYGHDRWSGTGRTVSRTGEPLHRLEPVPVNHFTG